MIQIVQESPFWVILSTSFRVQDFLKFKLQLPNVFLEGFFYAQTTKFLYNKNVKLRQQNFRFDYYES